MGTQPLCEEDLTALPLADRPLDANPPAASQQQLYYAFLSYSHQDSWLADWLHKQLERFVVPKPLVGRLTRNGVIPRRIAPVFRDRGELAASIDLGTEIREALAASKILIVLCSPAAAKSRWTNAEIDTFKRVRPDGVVLAAIAGGEPFASDSPGREDHECLPTALRVHYDQQGRPTSQRAEPLAADLREAGDGKRLGLLKLVAGMLGIGLDELVQREARRRQRRLAVVAAASLAGMAVTSGLAVAAIQARDSARDQRREAEGLVTFMVGDLRAKLEPVGRLDALDGVGSRVLAYYQKQGTSDLSDAALAKRSRALSMIAEVANARGDLPGALGLYREAAAGTAEAMRRDPSDPQRIFDHAQNVFYLGTIDLQRGNEPGAEAVMRQYKQLALRMVSIDPNNAKWRMEVQNADTNLGVLLYGQRRYTEAGAELEQALKSIEALAAAEPANGEYQKSLAESLAWLATVHTAEGQFERAIAERGRHVALLRRLIARTDDVHYRLRLLPAEGNLGYLYAVRGNLRRAIHHVRAGVTEADRLIALEPDNSKWHEFALQARLNLAQYLLAAGLVQNAQKETRAACATVEGLLNKDPLAPDWRAGLRDCWTMRAQLALATSNDEARRFAEQGVDVAQSVRSSDAIVDSFALARAYRLLGDARRHSGDYRGAFAAWTKAAGTIPRSITERPGDMREHALILHRLGRGVEAEKMESRLRMIGYHDPEFVIP